MGLIHTGHDQTCVYMRLDDIYKSVVSSTMCVYLDLGAIGLPVFRENGILCVQDPIRNSKHI